MEEIVLALELKAQLDALRPISNDEEQRIMQKFRLDWNYHSNNLEGNSLTYGETKALILFNITAQGKPLKDHFEITGHNEAINWVIDLVNGDRPLTESFIRELHTLLLKESYEVDAITPDGKPTKKRINVGSYKSTPNHIQTKTGEIFRFATPEETPSKMADLMEWYNSKSVEDNPNAILIAAEFHYKFIRIHPFDDGNGRTARILTNFILMKFGYPPVIIKTEDKTSYFAALQLADAGNIQAFINYIARNLVHSLQIMIAGAQGENIEEPDDIDKEIALLEKKLAGFGDKSSQRKLQETLEVLFDTTFFRFNEKFIAASLKFERFYIDLDLYYTVTKNTPQEDIFGDYTLQKSVKIFNNIKTIEHEFNEMLLEFTFVADYLNFNRLDFGEFNYSSKINFIFTEIAYHVSIDGRKYFEKPYNIDLTDEEIDQIIKIETKRHKEFIEQKISEKENEI